MTIAYFFDFALNRVHIGFILGGIFSTAIDLLCACFLDCKNAPIVPFKPGDREGRRTGINRRKAHQML